MLQRSRSDISNATLVLEGPDVKKSVESFQLSKKYISRLVKISLLNIIYHRINVPRNEFEARSYPGPYMVFKKDSQNSLINHCKCAGTGIIDAIGKDHLKEMRMFIIEKKSGQLLEMYILKVRYNKDDTKSNKMSKEVEEKTKNYLEVLNQLPGKILKEGDVELKFEILYNNDTPADYQPPHFTAAKEPFKSILSEPITLGQVDTGFHKLFTYAKGKNYSLSRPTTPASSTSYMQEDSPENEEIIVVEDEQLERDHDGDRQTDAKKAKLWNEAQDETNLCENTFTSGTNAEVHTLENISMESDERIQCLCSWHLPDDYVGIRCSKCFIIVHLVCHGYMSEKDMDGSSFVCLGCSRQKKQSLQSISKLMKLRVILYGIFRDKAIPEELGMAQTEDLTFIWEKLRKFKIVKNVKFAQSLAGSAPIDVNMAGVADAVRKFFTTNSEYFE